MNRPLTWIFMAKFSLTFFNKYILLPLCLKSCVLPWGNSGSQVVYLGFRIHMVKTNMQMKPKPNKTKTWKDIIFKETTKNCWVHFVLTVNCWAWDLAIRLVCILSETPLEKTNFSFVSNYQLDIASVLRMEAYVYFFYLNFNPMCLCPLKALLMLPQSLWFHVCKSHDMFRKILSLVSSITSGLYNLTTSSSSGFSEAKWEEFYVS